MGRNDRTATPDEQPQRRGRFFWICLLMLLMIAVWMIFKLVIDSDATRTWIAIAAGAVFVLVFRDRIWGADWRERLAAERAEQERKRGQRRS